MAKATHYKNLWKSPRDPGRCDVALATVARCRNSTVPLVTEADFASTIETDLVDTSATVLEPEAVGVYHLARRERKEIDTAHVNYKD